MHQVSPLLVIACGALAHDLVRIKQINNWPYMDIKCLPAILHNQPHLIADAVQKKIHEYRDKYQRIFVAYGDCGTGGQLDKVLSTEGVERLEGAHCYAFFSGNNLFEKLQQTELGTFYLTDYLVKNFQRLVIEGLALNRHPEFIPIIFGNYKKLVYLAQQNDAKLNKQAQAAACQLKLKFERIKTGDAHLTSQLIKQIETHPARIDAPIYQHSTLN